MAESPTVARGMMGKAVWVALAATLLAGCGERYAPGTVLDIVRGSGTSGSQDFTVDDGTYLIEERSEPAGCVTSVAILGRDGQTVATLRPPPSAVPPAPGREDPWNGSETMLSQGAYHAQATARAGCLWAVRISVPSS